MRFGPTLIGAIVGAAVGVVLHLALEILGGIEAPWFAVIIGLLVGLCVRKFDKSCAGQVSYVRGAIAGLIALGAIVGSTYVLGAALTKQASLVSAKPIRVTEGPAQADAASDNVGAPTSEIDPDMVEAPTKPIVGAGAGRVARRGEFNVLQFTFIALGTFIAYELGRGTVRAAASQQPAVEPPATVDPGAN
jgi:hypothetical protein